MLTVNKASVSARSVAAVRPCAISRSTVRVSCSVREEAPVSRREAALGTAAVAFATFLSAAPANAFLGFGDEKAEAEKYTQETSAILTKVKEAINLPKDDPSRDEVMKQMKLQINQWVATYRRDPKQSGRPSFGNTYSALNALAGHYNSFGATAPIPKKRLERLLKEVSDAENLLARGR